MEGFISFVVGESRAFDENGDNHNFQFCVVSEENGMAVDGSHILIDGVPHRCTRFSLYMNLLSFWVEPADLNGSETIDVVSDREAV
jgi:hypothetical protein